MGLSETSGSACASQDELEDPRWSNHPDREFCLTMVSGGDRADGDLVPLSALEPGESPRLHGVESGHVEALAGSHDLPAIVVQRSTMRVIDGLHRLNAARTRGQEAIRVTFLDCGDEEAFIFSVAANVRHGLPLTLADRRAAAVRIVALRPDASDRWIAEIAGLSAKTVASIRSSATGSISLAPGHATQRMGKDGRTRPLDAAEGRRRARDVLVSMPGASLRRIAREAGISIGTARDVREKFRQGADPAEPKSPSSSENGRARKIKADSEVDFNHFLQRLRNDPAVRYTDPGRALLRFLCPPRLIRTTDWKTLVSDIPEHRRLDVAQIARACAEAWEALAEELE